jgi:L-lactate dehydrogenase complex protein LldF
LAGLKFMPELPQALCTLCNACVEACPMDIALPHHFITLRRTLVEDGSESWGKRLTYAVWARLWARPGGFGRFVRWSRRGQRAAMRGGRLVRAPGLIGGWFTTRDMPPVAAETFHEWWARRRSENGNAGGDPA